MFEQLTETRHERERHELSAARWSAFEALLAPIVPADDEFVCATAGCFEDASCMCAEDVGSDGVSCAEESGAAQVAASAATSNATDDEAPFAWADKEELRLLVQHMDLDALLAAVPAHRIVSVLLDEAPSRRVVDVASALLAVPATTRRQGGWRPWVATELLTVWQRIESWVASQLDRAIVDVTGLHPVTLEDWEREEAALALRLAPRAAVAVVNRARARRDELRRVGAALADGTLLTTQANLLTDAVAHLDAEVIDNVLDRVLPVAGEQTRGGLDKLTKRAIIDADAEGAAARHEKAKADRGVCVVAQPEGMVDVILRCTAPEGERLFGEVDALARRNRAPGQLLDQARADAFIYLMLERSGVPFTASRVDLRVTMTEQAYLGQSDDPATLDNYGPITAQAARELLNADTTLRLAITDASTGGLKYLSSPSRLATGRLAEHVVTRDVSCRMLGCNRPAERCDLDHTVKHKDYGPTCACNLAPLCRRHHRMKDKGGWQLIGTHGRLRWTTPSGREYDVRSEICDPSVFPQPEPDILLCLSPCLAHPRPDPDPGVTAQVAPDDHSLEEAPCPF